MSVLSTHDLLINVPGREGGTPLNLTIEPGQSWGVLGPNGAGKTTLLHTLAGLHAPRSGEVRLGDQPLSQLRRRHIARRLGLVFQDRQDGFPASVLETVLIGRHPYLSPWQMEGADDYARAEAALERLDVAHLRVSITEPPKLSIVSSSSRASLRVKRLCQVSVTGSSP